MTHVVWRKWCKIVIKRKVKNVKRKTTAQN